MPSPRARSAALLISLYVDEEGGAPWYARLQAFDEGAAADLHVERFSDKAELLLAVRRWLEDGLPDE